MDLTRSCLISLPKASGKHLFIRVSDELLRGTNFVGNRAVSLTFGTHPVAVKRSEPRSTLRWRSTERFPGSFAEVDQMSQRARVLQQAKAADEEEDKRYGGSARVRNCPKSYSDGKRG